MKTSKCVCCHREISLTFHHLIPKKVHRRTRFAKHYSKAELNLGIYICRACHSGIHRFYDEMYLAQHLNSLAALLSDEKLQKHFDWVGKQRVSTTR